ncbi:MAG: UvrD-helicase domain-containing protein [Anaerolineales bacterium]|nr:UvrD-helicase domain-containing protein [Anaerolineales bacterium]
MIDFLAKLNTQQQQAVTAGLGPVLVLAGPGSGKTRVLTQRIAYLISQMGVSPYHILAVTFTNKAAREMENRLQDLIGPATRGLTLGTFHATCARILRREAEHLPFQSNFVIFDSDDQLNVVKQALRDLNLDEKRNKPAGIHAAISNAKNELILPDNFKIANYRDETTKRVYKRYQELLLISNAVDFDDLLLWTAFLFQENQAVRERYARRYEHVLVDEFQDTNLAQYTLLNHLASFHQNLFVVGDEDQSIYRWRGADYRNVLRFESDYRETQVILLEQNYRSTQSILDAAMAVIDRNPNRTRKKLFTELGAGEKITLHEAYDDRVEAAFITETIASLVARQQAEPGDFAVMYRTNAQSRLLEEAFLAAGLPYKLVGAQRFYGRREVKDLIAYLRLVHNPDDEISLTRVINIPARGIGEKTYLVLRTLAQNNRQSAGAALLGMTSDPNSTLRETFPGRGAGALIKFGDLLANWVKQKNELTPLALMDRVLEDVEYHAYIDDGTQEGQDRWDNVMELRRLAAEFEQKDLTAFLEQVALVSDQDTLETNASVPTLLTLHAAKGLEFPVVFIVGLNDGTLPHSRSFEDPEEMLEERRLLYVGITRAKKRLYLVFAQNRSSYGYAEPVDPSRFLNDIPEDLVTSSQPLHTRRVERYLPVRPERWQVFQEQPAAPVSKDRPQTPARTIPPKTPTPQAARYRPGMRVQHATLGEGMVLKSQVQDDDEIVDVFFAGLGLKRLMASMARLEIKQDSH